MIDIRDSDFGRIQILISDFEHVRAPFPSALLLHAHLDSSRMQNFSW